jgi:hypothetical protein
MNNQSQQTKNRVEPGASALLVVLVVLLLLKIQWQVMDEERTGLWLRQQIISVVISDISCNG